MDTIRITASCEDFQIPLYNNTTFLARWCEKELLRIDQLTLCTLHVDQATPEAADQRKYLLELFSTYKQQVEALKTELQNTKRIYELLYKESKNYINAYNKTQLRQQPPTQDESLLIYHRHFQTVLENLRSHVEETHYALKALKNRYHLQPLGLKNNYWTSRAIHVPHDASNFILDTSQDVTAITLAQMLTSDTYYQSSRLNQKQERREQLTLKINQTLADMKQEIEDAQQGSFAEFTINNYSYRHLRQPEKIDKIQLWEYLVSLQAPHPYDASLDFRSTDKDFQTPIISGEYFDFNLSIKHQVYSANLMNCYGESLKPIIAQSSHKKNMSLLSPLYLKLAIVLYIYARQVLCEAERSPLTYRDGAKNFINSIEIILNTLPDSFPNYFNNIFQTCKNITQDNIKNCSPTERQKIKHDNQAPTIRAMEKEKASDTIGKYYLAYKRKSILKKELETKEHNKQMGLITPAQQEGIRKLQCAIKIKQQKQQRSIAKENQRKQQEVSQQESAAAPTKIPISAHELAITDWMGEHSRQATQSLTEEERYREQTANDLLNKHSELALAFSSSLHDYRETTRQKTYYFGCGFLPIASLVSWMLSPIATYFCRSLNSSAEKKRSIEYFILWIDTLRKSQGTEVITKDLIQEAFHSLDTQSKHAVCRETKPVSDNFVKIRLKANRMQSLFSGDLPVNQSFQQKIALTIDAAPAA